MHRLSLHEDTGTRMIANLVRRFRTMRGQYAFRSHQDKSLFVHEKLGTRYGGWSIPTELLDVTSVCYCVGAGEDISFDLQLINRIGCSVYTFDPTPRAHRHVELLRENTFLSKKTFVNGGSLESYQCDASTLSHLHFLPYGLWSETKTMRFYAPKDPTHVSHSLVNLQRTQEYFEADCRTMKGVMSELNHSAISLLKLDVEGAEYQIIDSMLADDILPLILCVEFDEGHNPQDNAYLDRISGTIQKLKKAGYLATFFDKWNATFIQIRSTNQKFGNPIASNLHK